MKAMAFASPKRLDADALREYAGRLLAGRALSVAELKDRLRRRAVDEADIDPIVRALKDYGVLNDTRYSEHFAERRSGDYGRQRVLTELKKRKVAPKVAEKAVESAFSGTNEAELVTSWLGRKYRNQDLGALLQAPAKLAAVYRRLRVAGFSAGASIRVLRRWAAEADQLEGLEDS
jgi:regulatory protein